MGIDDAGDVRLDACKVKVGIAVTVEAEATLDEAAEEGKKQNNAHSEDTSRFINLGLHSKS